MDLNLKEQVSSFIRTLPDVEQKHDPMSEEAYFYCLRNFAHFHGPQHIDIRLSKPQQQEALQIQRVPNLVAKYDMEIKPD